MRLPPRTAGSITAIQPNEAWQNAEIILSRSARLPTQKAIPPGRPPPSDTSRRSFVAMIGRLFRRRRFVGGDVVSSRVCNPMQVTRTVAYAVQSMVELSLAPPGCPVPCRTLASRGDIPQRYLLQILRELVACGFLESVPGVAGGYLLAKCADSITLLDIVDAVDNRTQPRIPDGVRLSQSLRRHLLSRMTKVAAAFRQELGSVTLAELARQRASS